MNTSKYNFGTLIHSYFNLVSSTDNHVFIFYYSSNTNYSSTRLKIEGHVLQI